MDSATSLKTVADPPVLLSIVYGALGLGALLYPVAAANAAAPFNFTTEHNHDPGNRSLG